MIELLHTLIDNQSIELVSVLGSGSYGVVFLGRYIYTNRYYAVKCLRDNHITRNEIEVHSTLSGHSNILTLEKVVREGNRVFIIMEYATHGDLFSCITQPQLAQNIIGKTKVVRHLFLQILDAVQHCHHHLIAHRDLKPENILLLSNHRIKLADFGLATTQAISKEFNCGSSFYFSPECQGVTPHSNSRSQKVTYYDTLSNDVWSLGIILINLVSGRNPWKQANLQDPAFAAYVEQPRRFFRTILPNISKSLNRILTRVFCLDPAKRISLSELRTMVLGCRMFTMSPVNIVSGGAKSIQTKPTNILFPAQRDSLFDLSYSESLTSTMLAYIGDYTDDDEGTHEDLLAPTSSAAHHCLSSFCSSDSSSSISTTGDSLLTPYESGPVSSLHCGKQQQGVESIKSYRYH